MLLHGSKKCGLSFSKHRVSRTCEHVREVGHNQKNKNLDCSTRLLPDKQHKHHTFIETYSLKRGIKTFGDDARNAASGEMKQLHERAVFVPVNVSELPQRGRCHVLESLVSIVQERDREIKARTCANGSTQRKCTSKEDATSPTVLTESILLTAAIEAREGRDVMTADIPNASVQTDVHNTKSGDRTVMKI